ncbi:type II and III secretion system protein [Rubrivirga sp. S365]|uniref:Type II and III secretion system protein n=1 Tax=Rubrivirga litoralis TaxID=3075598 RepID=A0ABU3BMQ5_9BACT|nr:MULTISPECIES: type II and III secretion system protein [unclassified Rubrivirga]MDT0630556.1 type II and III secretion system protein [Rubrivirga sp. F394]MDT7857732.1 type II and III secretion system protein [Rubrivirga sp. S365]
MTHPAPRPRRLLALASPSLLGAALLAALALPTLGAPAAHAQASELVRGYVPPAELVSFPASTPMDQFLRLVNPTFFRVTGKRVVDPLDRQDAIGVSLSGVHFVDAFELVLDRGGLDFAESDGYFIVTDPAVVATTSDGQVATPIGAAGPVAAAASTLPATADTREIRIDAIIFELNTSRSREVGTNWAALFGQAAGQGGAGGGQGGGVGGGGGEQAGNAGARPTFYVDGGTFFDALDGFLEVSSDRIELSFLLNLFRYLEQEGFGQTIAAPFTTVQSGETAKIQSGQDIPINLRDFSGNTVSSFVSTGVIINALPTLIVDEREGAPVEFIHLDVNVEKSSGTPSAFGIAINKNSTTTQIPLLSGEMRAIGGLTSQEESFTRSGVPILKDIPILKYLFSYKQKQVTKKELIVVLQARVVDDLRTRQAGELPRSLLRQEREDVRERMDRFNAGSGQRLELPEPADPVRVDQ